MKFTYGFTTKAVHGKRYVYFWRYTGSGHKTEKYVGRAGKIETEKRSLRLELEYLQGLQEELTSRILQVKVNLAQGEPSLKDRHLFQEMYKKANQSSAKKKSAEKKKRRKSMQVATATRPSWSLTE